MNVKYNDTFKSRISECGSDDPKAKNDIDFKVFVTRNQDLDQKGDSDVHLNTFILFVFYLYFNTSVIKCSLTNSDKCTDSIFCLFNSLFIFYIIECKLKGK